MTSLVIGATGLVGGGVAARLRDAGHHVTGLARSASAADRLSSRGITPLSGDLADGLPAVVAAAATADAVIYAAQPADPRAETATVAALLDVMAGGDAPLMFVSGTGVLLQRTAGAWSADSFAEDDPFVVEPRAVARHATEQAVRHGAARGVRTIVLRPGTVWGPDDDHGHLARVYASVAATGAACHVGDGLATYSHVHVEDLARLAELALSRGHAGALYHAAAGETPNRWIAEAVARDLDVPTRRLTTDAAARVWGELGALVMSASSRCRDPRSRVELGWTPQHLDMLAAVGDPTLRRLADRAA